MSNGWEIAGSIVSFVGTVWLIADALVDPSGVTYFARQEPG